MVNQYYDAGEQRAARVNDLFAAIAPRYDLINDLQSFGLHRLWKRRCVRLARVQPGERALDLCCGTGDIAFELAAGGAEVVGLDFSAPMLVVARQRAAVQTTKFKVQSSRFKVAPAPGSGVPGSELRNPHFLQSDALNIPFPDAHFDIVTIGYGLRNLASFDGGLREMCRVTKPGGRLLVLDFGVPDNTVWRAIYFAYLRWFVPVLGRIFCRDAAAYAYILESLKNYPAQKGVAARMQELGCCQIEIHNLLGGMMSINYGEKPAGPA